MITGKTGFPSLFENIQLHNRKKKIKKERKKEAINNGADFRLPNVTSRMPQSLLIRLR